MAAAGESLEKRFFLKKVTEGIGVGGNLYMIENAIFADEMPATSRPIFEVILMFVMKFFFTAFLILIVNSEANAQTAETVEGEVALDLDELDEEEREEGSLEDNEPLLPVTGTIMEVERSRGLMLVALAVLVPVAAMLLPVRRKHRQKTASSKKKEIER